MSSFKKYLLIDPDKYEEMVSKTKTLKSDDILVHPNIKAVKQIDRVMSSILNDSEKSDQQKVDEYSSNLDSYLRNFKNALQVTKQDAILGKRGNDILAVNPVDGNPPIHPQNTSDIERAAPKQDIPASYRPAASHLTAFLNKNKNFEVGKNGELKYKGKKRFQSHYPELLDGVVRSRKPTSGTKDDINDLVSLLKQEGYPVTRLGYVRRNNTGKVTSKAKSTSTIEIKQKPSKLQRSIDRLSTGVTPKKQKTDKFSPAKIYEKWEKV